MKLKRTSDQTIVIKLPISITPIKPTAIHTPFPENAKSYLPYKPQLPSPLYAPDLVAEAILHCAEHPTRDFFVGGMAKVHSSMSHNVPRLQAASHSQRGLGRE